MAHLLGSHPTIASIEACSCPRPGYVEHLQFINTLLRWSLETAPGHPEPETKLAGFGRCRRPCSRSPRGNRMNRSRPEVLSLSNLDGAS
jgi:hypothetical protein